MTLHHRIVITGMGVCSAIGCDVPTTAKRLEAGTTGLQEFVDQAPGLRLWAGLARDVVPPSASSIPDLHSVDRIAWLAIHAASEARLAARLDEGRHPPSSMRVGLAFGTSHGGRSQLDRFIETGSDPRHPEMARRLLVRAAHHEQAELLAQHLGIHGPVITLSSACSSSATAIAHACALLQAGKADVMIAGGADAFSLLTAAGFQALKATANGPCSPFSSRIGMSLGEGAGFVILESLENAQRREALIQAELFGYGLSWDAYHITEPEPTGAGVLRALVMAARSAGISPREIDYLHAHGTGTRANDGAESQAILQFFQEGAPPPVSATKSFTGHTLGASSALGLIFSIIAMNRGLLPPTVNFEERRAGCTLDYVPNQARPHPIRSFIVNSSGFGGTNAVLIGGRLASTARHERRSSDDAVVITGLGVVSPIGCGTEAFLEGLRNNRCGIDEIRSFDTGDCPTRHAGWIQDFDARRLIPTVDSRRMDRVMQFALAAAHEAMGHAGLRMGTLSPERLGLVVGTTRGAITSFEKYLASVAGQSWRKASPIYFPNLVMSSIGGQVSRALGIRGLASTIINGTTGGLHALVHGYELLRQNPSQDALIIVAADELGPLFHRLYAQLGLLAHHPEGHATLRPYAPDANGMLLGEGAVAIVLERLSSARSRSARLLGQVDGAGLTSDACGYLRLEPEGKLLEHAMRLALQEAHCGVDDVDLLLGHGRGLPSYDSRELLAFHRLLAGRSVPVSCIMGHTGVAEAACGLFSVAASLLSLQHRLVFPLLSQGPLPTLLPFARSCFAPARLQRVLLAGSTDSGSNAALLLSRPRET